MSTTPADFFADSPLGLRVYERILEIVSAPDVTVRASRSQVKLARRRGFAYLWLPGRYLRNPAAEVVLSIALPDRLASQRFKEVVHPSPAVWLHHLEIRSIADVDAEVAGWLREASTCAA